MNDLAPLDMEPKPPAPAREIIPSDETLIGAACSWLAANDPDEIRQQDIWIALGMPAHAWTGAHGSRIIDGAHQKPPMVPERPRYGHVVLASPCAGTRIDKE